MASTDSRWHRLEFTAVTRRRPASVGGYGFVLFEDGTGRLLATGCGPVLKGTYNEAVHIALLEGLKVARAHGAKHLLLHCDSGPALKQVTSSLAAKTQSAQVLPPLTAAVQQLQQFDHFEIEKVDRQQNGLAVLQAEFACELYSVLQKVGTASPSKYVAVSGQLGLLLQLPITARRWLESSDDFVEAAAQVIAARCGTTESDVLATIHNIVSTTSNSKSSCSLPAQPILSAAADRIVCFHMSRTFSPEEGASYAAAAAKAEAEAATNAQLMSEARSDSEPGDAGVDVFDMEVAPSTMDSDEDNKSSKRRVLNKTRGVGRHRLSHRLLVVGLHNLPPDWAQQPLQQPRRSQQHISDGAPTPARPKQTLQLRDTAAAASSSSCNVHSDFSSAETTVQPMGDKSAVVADALSPPAASIPATGVLSPPDGPSPLQPEALNPGLVLGDDLVAYWASKRKAGGVEAVGLGDARYQLPQVASDTATHLLQFDGASRNNPGRGGYGYVVFDLANGQITSRGCMTLPYGHTAVAAEFEGLIAGLKAALDAGIKQLAVQGDSVHVIGIMLHNRSGPMKSTATLYQRACQLVAQFDHVDFQFIGREQNTLADRLANISMDIDTALYAVLRRGASDIDALRMLFKATRISKKQESLELLFETFEFPLLVCVLLNRVMALSPQQLLERLQSKAEHMGDPNPALVQEVRKIVATGIPQDIMQHVGAVMMDSRYSRKDMVKLRTEATLIRSRHPKQQGIVQQQQRISFEHPNTRHYCQAPQPTNTSTLQGRRFQHSLREHLQSQSRGRSLATKVVYSDMLVHDAGILHNLLDSLPPTIKVIGPAWCWRNVLPFVRRCL